MIEEQDDKVGQVIEELEKVGQVIEEWDDKVGRLIEEWDDKVGRLIDAGFMLCCVGNISAILLRWLSIYCDYFLS